jgi:hypothetical protein
MARTPAEQRTALGPLGPLGSPMDVMGILNDYPSGLSICLTEVELAKLGLDSDCEAGDMINLDAVAKVISCSSRVGQDDVKTCRVELQIVMLGIEQEPENDKPAGPPASRAKRYATSAAEEAAEGE